MTFIIKTYDSPSPSDITIICFGSAANISRDDRFEFFDTLSKSNHNKMFVKECNHADRYSFYLEALSAIDEAFLNIDPSKRVHVRTIGWSSGGFAAIAYGRRFNATHIMGINPAVNIAREFLDGLPDAKKPKGIMTCRVVDEYKTSKKHVELMFGGRYAIPSHQRVLLFVSRDNPYDVEQSSHLSGDTLSVQMVPTPDHDIKSHLPYVKEAIHSFLTKV